MSTTIWTYQFLAPEAGGNYAEQQRPVDEIGRSLGGKTAVLNRAANREFTASGWVVLPDGTNNPSDFDDFVETMDGRVDTFLYKAQRARHRQIQLGALGTGDASTVAFAFSDGTNLHKHLDADTLLVYVSGTLQTGGGTDYTLSANNTDPLITFEAGSTPGGAAPITVSYEFYQPVRFARDDFPTRVMTSSGDDDINSPEAIRIQVELIEDYPGARFA
jgi:hypothetical protein